MLQPLKFCRLAAGSIPDGGWKKGSLYFVYGSDGNGELLLATQDNSNPRANNPYLESYTGSGEAGSTTSDNVLLCDISDELSDTFLRWPLLRLNLIGILGSYPELQSGIAENPELAPYYVDSEEVIRETEGLEDNVASYPSLVIALSSDPEIAPILVDTEGLDAIVAENPSIAEIIVSYPTLASYCVQYPSIVASLIKWPALAPILVETPEYIPYLSEDEIIAHSLINTGKRAWIVGDGTAYINTGLYQLEWPLKIDTYVAYNDINAEMYFGGNFTSSSNGSRIGLKSKKHTMYSSADYQPISTLAVLRQEYAIESEFSGLTGKKMTVDGVVNEKTDATNKVGASNLPFGFFSCKGNALTNGLKGRLSVIDLTIGESTYHYIPAMYDGKYGYLETSSMEFKGNNNTSGQFMAMTTIKNNG